jgi:hypothetical protein
MPTKAFLEARKQGEIAQRYVKGMFEPWSLNSPLHREANTPAMMGILEGKFYGQYVRSKIEIKYDRLASTAGNVCLDIQSPSTSGKARKFVRY